MLTLKNSLAIAFVSTLLLPGCLVFRSFPGGNAIGRDHGNNHPHGGPPGQDKDKKGNNGRGNGKD